MSVTGKRGSGWASPSATASFDNSVVSCASTARPVAAAASPSFYPESFRPYGLRYHQDNPQPSGSPQTSGGTTPQRVLLVEDDPVSASALNAILRRRGFDVLPATTLAQAMDLLQQRPAFVVLDLMLPDGDGAAVLRHVRKTRPETRVLVTTAVSDPERLRALRALGPDVILQKPIDLNALLKLIETPN